MCEEFCLAQLSFSVLKLRHLPLRYIYAVRSLAEHPVCSVLKRYNPSTCLTHVKTLPLPPRSCERQDLLPRRFVEADNEEFREVRGSLIQKLVPTQIYPVDARAVQGLCTAVQTLSEKCCLTTVKTEWQPSILGGHFSRSHLEPGAWF